MKKIFVLTGEPSGDKLASTVISKLKINNPDIEYLSVGGTHIKKLGIQSIFDLKDITYLGFTSVILNIFKIRKKIDKTVYEIVKFNSENVYIKIIYNGVPNKFINELKAENIIINNEKSIWTIK